MIEVTIAAARLRFNSGTRKAKWVRYYATANAVLEDGSLTVASEARERGVFYKEVLVTHDIATQEVSIPAHTLPPTETAQVNSGALRWVPYVFDERGLPIAPLLAREGVKLPATPTATDYAAILAFTDATLPAHTARDAIVGGIVTAAGYNGIRNQDVPDELTDKILTDATITRGVSTNIRLNSAELDAPEFVNAPVMPDGTKINGNLDVQSITLNGTPVGSTLTPNPSTVSTALSDTAAIARVKAIMDGAEIVGKLKLTNGAATRTFNPLEASTNLFIYPSAESASTPNGTKTTGTSTSTFARSADRARTGAYSYKHEVTVGNANPDAYRIGSNRPLVVGQIYTLSAWVWVVSGGTVRITLAWRDSGGAGIGTTANSAVAALTGQWVRLTATATAPVGGTAIECRFNQTGVGLVYWDDIQLEAKGYATDYLDGSLGSGYAWLGTAHLSTSTRAEQTTYDAPLVASAGVAPGSRTAFEFPNPGIAGRMLHLSDGVGGLHIDNGVAWNRAMPSVNVKSFPFRARGDGATDDYAAFANALLALAAIGGGKLVVPNGVYMLSAQLIVPTNVIIEGEGRQTSFLKATTTHNNANIISFAANARNVRIISLGFDDVPTSGDTQNTRPQSGIGLDGNENCRVEDCWFADRFNWGVFIYNSINCGVSDSVIEGTLFSHGVEIGVSTGGTARANFIRNNIIRACYGNNIELYVGLSGSLLDTKIVGNTLEGTRVGGVASSRNIATFGDKRSIIEANHISGGAAGGMYSASAGLNAAIKSDRGIFAHNEVFDCGGTQHDAVVFNVESEHWKNDSNIIVNSGGSGITDYGKYNEHDGNTVEGARKTGIYLDGAISPQVRGGHVLDSGTGTAEPTFDAVSIVGGSGAIVEGVTCTDRRVGTAKRQRYGVTLIGTSGALINGNQVGGNATGTIYNGTVGGGGSSATNNLPDNGTTATP